MSRIAKGPSDSLFKNKRARTIAKGGGFGLGLGLDGGLRSPENTVMRNPIDIDSKHSRAIVREIGGGLRASFKEDRRVTRELQNANRTTPPIRRRDAAQRLSRVFERHERFALRQFDRL